jgi:hypothetical protein
MFQLAIFRAYSDSVRINIISGTAYERNLRELLFRLSR